MNSLKEIKRHVDGHGFGSVIVEDHVVIDVVWTRKTLNDGERKREMTERVYSLEEACAVIGCRCGPAA
ncbi:MAG TPA: hypothetical protein PKM48_02345 [Parvularculaceae bacterium]|nr:hypothetical protein [Parvularculaceae bacterium]HNS85737.1 hypothetical protein [Parvularculaceae bacterium]